MTEQMPIIGTIPVYAVAEMETVVTVGLRFGTLSRRALSESFLTEGRKQPPTDNLECDAGGGAARMPASGDCDSASPGMEFNVQ